MPGEKRKLERKNLVYYLKISDRDSGQILGHLVDITVDGLMIIRQTPLPTGRDYHLRLHLPSEDRPNQVIDFDARSVWCRPDVNTDYHGVGFQFTAITELDRDKIMELIDDYLLPGKVRS